VNYYFIARYLGYVKELHWKFCLFIYRLSGSWMTYGLLFIFNLYWEVIANCHSRYLNLHICHFVNF
jgi:hypothetical protein